MKISAAIFFLFYSCVITGQPGLYRHFPQPVPSPSSFGYSKANTPIRTADGGYLISIQYWFYALHSPAGNWYSYIIKTDSAFVPQWKKFYPKALALPSGGILLYGHNTIEKVTTSGSQVWVQTVGGGIGLEDAVAYGNKVRFVGAVSSNYFPYSWVNDGVTLLIDSNGTYHSHQVFSNSAVNGNNSNLPGSADFTRIKQDPQGNFWVFSSSRQRVWIASDMVIAKFDTAFNLLWASTRDPNTPRSCIEDISFLPNGDVIAAASTAGVHTNTYSAPAYATMMRFDPQGNITQQHFLARPGLLSDMCRKSSGNFIISMQSGDSLFMAEISPSLTITWHRYIGKGSAVSGSMIKNNQVFTAKLYGLDPVLISNDSSGISCASYSLPCYLATSSVSLISCTLSPISSSVSFSAGTVSSFTTQTYADSCNCPVFIPRLQQNICINHTGTVNIAGSGNLSWYGSPGGNDFLRSGPQFTFSSSTPTSITVYAQDSICSLNPNRTAISLTVFGVPQLTFSPASPTICTGGQVFLYVSGARSYTWNPGHFLSNIISANPSVTTVYTVAASNAPGCDATQTVTLHVIPPPALTITGPSTVCTGVVYTYSAAGMDSFKWANNHTGPTFSILPSGAGIRVFNVEGSIGSCNIYKQVTITVVATPTLMVAASPTLICAGKSASLKVFGASGYSWSTGASASLILVSPQASSAYTVSGMTSVCSSTAAVSINVQALPILKAAASKTLACTGDTLIFTASGASSYSWSGGQSGSTFTLQTPAGLAISTVTATDGTCVATATVAVLTHSYPGITVTSNPSQFCIGKPSTLIASGANSYTWSNASLANSIVIIPSSASTYTIRGQNSICSTTKTLNVIPAQNPTVSIALNKHAICQGDTIHLQATGAQSYKWNNGSAQHSLSESATSSQVYSVTGTNHAGCTSHASVFVTVLTVPAISITPGAKKVCANVPILLKASGAFTYTWNTGSKHDTLHDAPNMTRSYSVSGTGFSGCISSASIQVAVTPQPTLSLFYTGSRICAGESVTLTVSGADTYTWNTSNTFTMAVITPIYDRTVNVSGTASTGCRSSVSFKLYVDQCTAIQSNERASNRLHAYPVPARDFVTLVIPAGSAGVVFLYDCSGRHIRTYTCDSAISEISISDLSPGLYFLGLNDGGLPVRMIRE